MVYIRLENYEENNYYFILHSFYLICCGVVSFQTYFSGYHSLRQILYGINYSSFSFLFVTLILPNPCKLQKYKVYHFIFDEILVLITFWFLIIFLDFSYLFGTLPILFSFIFTFFLHKLELLYKF
jgi:hypothetical protein